MILSKQFLSEQVQKSYLNENFSYGGLFYNKTRAQLSQYDVFISYSWNDRAYADKIVQLLEKCGYKVYIDFNDNRLDRNNVSEETAKCIINEMTKCKGLLYLYSPNSSLSKWCPWEVGVFSGMKSFKCANLPLTQYIGEDFKKQEYLEIYPYVEYVTVQNTNRYDFWVCESERKYTSLRNWLSGQSLTNH